VLAILIVGAASASAQTPAAPAPPRPPLVLTVSWDSAPHNISTARNFQTLFELYGRGADALYEKASLFDRGARGVIARLARAPLDAYVAWLASVAGHEFGHCQQAWFAGSRECHWVSAPGPYALGHVISIGDFGQLSPAGRQASTAGGTLASVVGADSLKREMFEAGHAGWTAAPLLAFRQFDISLYGLTSPSPAEAGPLDYANDMTNYAARYGSRSGRGGEAVHDAIVRGAWWNAADPLTWSATYGYFARYVVRGERTARVPGVALGGRRWMVTTSAWLSEVGVRQSLGILSRGSAGDMVEITPSWGEQQPALAVRWSRTVSSGLQATISADVWRQRTSAAPGPLNTGGSFAAAVSRAFGRVRIAGDVGYKSAGAMLTRPHQAGWFFAVGTSVVVTR